MAWDTTIVSLVRYFINDLDSAAYTWTDTQLKKFILVSISFLDMNLRSWPQSYGGPYVIDFDALTVTPDPVDANYAPAFVPLIALGAAKNILRSDYKKLSVTGGWKIQDDRSSIDNTAGLAASKSALADMELAYKEALLAFKEGNMVVAIAILTPYSSPNHYPFGYPSQEGNYRGNY